MPRRVWAFSRCQVQGEQLWVANSSHCASPRYLSGGCYGLRETTWARRRGGLALWALRWCRHWHGPAFKSVQIPLVFTQYGNIAALAQLGWVGRALCQETSTKRVPGLKVTTRLQGRALPTPGGFRGTATDGGSKPTSYRTGFPRECREVSRVPEDDPAPDTGQGQAFRASGVLEVFYCGS